MRTAGQQSPECRLRRLYRLIENGVTDLGDLLRSHSTSLKPERQPAEAILDGIGVRAVLETAMPRQGIEQFGWTMHENITTDEAPFHKALLRLVIDCVEVGAHATRIVGGRSGRGRQKRTCV